MILALENEISLPMISWRLGFTSYDQLEIGLPLRKARGFASLCHVYPSGCLGSHTVLFASAPQQIFSNLDIISIRIAQYRGVSDI
jgi:hypothetical protein